ncbi:hypothetical protein SAMN02799624_05338 [Paenibacillus sp. UNC496MF]|uniref:hypothetical protein n=1 Tax=Paenibacillus sp. UNC496MF TaxID=1502753 RepID=UPI0008EE39D2|nr:hypothetical protein [Paenibacillus sp. UNC496MF]SFJ64386.1 hypothetical protein SAMN02799624_05338 [Paenibacillus sp. UNC496MF]
MDKSIVIHVNGGVAEVASNPFEVPVVIIDFDNSRELPDLGTSDANIICPKCKHAGSQLEWNAATHDDFSGGDPDAVFVRIQHATAGTEFTCAYCYQTSTTEEIGLTPIEPLESESSAVENPDDLKCPKCLSDAENVSGAFVEAGEWDGKSYELEVNVHRYRCRNAECAKEFFF